MRSEEHLADAEKMFAEFSDEPQQINATPVHLQAATREFLATISAAISYKDISTWDEDGQREFSRWNEQIQLILQYKKPLMLGNLNFAEMVGEDVAKFLRAFIETEILLFTGGRTLPPARKLALKRREKDLEDDNEYQTGWWAHVGVGRRRFRYPIRRIYGAAKLERAGMDTLTF